MNLLAIIEAGAIKEDDNVLALMQNVSHEHAHVIGKWLALAVDGHAHLRLIGFAGTEEIHYGARQVREEMEAAARRQQQKHDEGAAYDGDAP